MITMLDALDGLYKWKDRCTQTITDGFARYSGGITREGVETIAKYYYYLGACNAFVIADLKHPKKAYMPDLIVKNKWLGKVNHDV